MNLKNNRAPKNRKNEIDRKFLFFFLGIILLSVVLRFYQLSADPPPSVGLHFISDEGWWVHNARNKVLFGEWVLDEFNQSLLISPLFCFSAAFFFSIMGVGFTSARMTSALAGTVFVLWSSLWAGKKWGAKTGLIVGLMTGLDFVLISINRIAFVDSLMLVFVWGVYAFWESSRKRTLFSFISGLCLGLAYVTKSYSLFFGPLLLLIAAAEGFINKKAILTILKRLFLFGAGFLLIIIAWILLLLIPYWSDFKIMYHLWTDGNFPRSGKEALKNIVNTFFFISDGKVHPRKFFHLGFFYPLLFSLFWCKMLLKAKNLKKTFTNLNIEKLDFLIWFLWAILFILPLTAKPLRRYLILISPSVMLGATFLIGRKEYEEKGLMRHSENRVKMILALLPLGITLGTIFSVLPANLILNMISRNAPLPPPHMHIMAIAAGSLAAASAFFLLVGSLFRIQVIRFLLHPHKTKVLILLFLAYVATLHGHGFYYRTHSLRDVSRELRAIFNESVTVLGGTADTLCLENKARTIAIWGREEADRVLNENPVKRFDPDYLMIPVKMDGPWIREERYARYARKDLPADLIKVLPEPGGGYRVEVELYRLE